MDEANLYGVLTILAFLVLLPISLLVEPPAAIMASISAAQKAGLTVTRARRLLRAPTLSRSHPLSLPPCLVPTLSRSRRLPVRCLP